MAGPIRIAVLANGALARRDLNATATSAERAGSRFSRAGVRMRQGLAIGGVAALALGKAVISLSSDAEQSLGATETVFGKYADRVERESNRAANAVGLSANEYRESANLIGSLLKNQGVVQDQLAGKTDRLVKIGADLAATFGGPTSDAVAALGSAFKGEFDPLEQYGISIKQSAINTEAMTVANVASITEFNKLTLAQQSAAKQQATNNLLTKQSADVAGAFGRESDTLAGAQQRLYAELKNVGVEAGTSVLPLLTDLAQYARREGVPALEDLAHWFGENQSEIRSTADELGDTLLPVLRTLNTLGGVAVDVLAAIPGPVREFGVQAAIATRILPSFTGQITNASGETLSYGQQLRGAETRTAALGRAAKYAAGAAGIALLIRGLGNSEDGLGLFEGAVGGALTGFSIGGGWGAVLGAAGGALTSFSDDSDVAATKQQALADAQQRVTDTLAAQTGAYTKRTKAQLVADLGDQGMLQLAQEIGVPLDQMTRSILQGKEGIQQFRDAYINSLPDDQITNFVDLTNQMRKLSNGLESGQRGWLLNRQAMGKSGAEVQAVREKVRRLATTYEILPNNIRTIVRSVGADDSRANIRRLAREYKTTPKVIRTLFSALGTARVKGQAADVRRSLEDSGKAKPKTDMYLRALLGDTAAAERIADRGGKGVSAKLMSGTAKARANLTQFDRSIQSGTASASVLASTGGRSIGSDLSSGVSSGFAGTGDRLAREAAAAVRQAVTAARSEAKAKSPSRVWMKLGADMGDGLVLGKRSRRAAVKREGRELARSAASGAKAGQSGHDKAEAALKRMNNRLDQAVEKYGRLRKAADDYAKGVRSAVLGFGAITALGEGDGFGTLDQFLQQMRDRVATAERWEEAIKALSQAGLNKRALQELIDQGPDALGTAELILSGGKEAVRETNRLQKQLGKTADDLGKAMRRKFHAAGLAAAAGIIAGLRKRRNEIRREMQRTADTGRDRRTSSVNAASARDTLGRLAARERLDVNVKLTAEHLSLMAQGKQAHLALQVYRGDARGRVLS